jgi:hypothetical protein
MDVTPTDETPKRRRTKIVVKAPAAPKPARKTLTVRKQPQTPSVVVESHQRPAIDLQTEIAKAAFYLAAERNFTPGHELDDWLEAERRIKAS